MRSGLGGGTGLRAGAGSERWGGLRAAAAGLLLCALAGCGSSEPEPLFRQGEPGDSLTVKIFDGWRMAGQRKGSALVVLELPEGGRFAGRPEVKVNGQPHAATLGPRQVSITYYPISPDGRVETRPVTVAARWQGKDPKAGERHGDVRLILMYEPNLSFAVQDCEAIEAEGLTPPPMSGPTGAGSPAAPPGAGAGGGASGAGAGGTGGAGTSGGS